MCAKEEKRVLSRKGAFFGLHFDLHPTEKDTELGVDITEEMIERPRSLSKIAQSGVVQTLTGDVITKL